MPQIWSVCDKDEEAIEENDVQEKTPQMFRTEKRQERENDRTLLRHINGTRQKQLRFITSFLNPLLGPSLRKYIDL